VDRMPGTILLLIVIVLIHLAEEIKTGFRKKFPLGEMPRPLFIGGNVVFYTFCFATLFLSAQGHELAIPLAWIFAVAMLANGVVHIGMMALRRRYFPGGATALLLIPVSVYLITQFMSWADWGGGGGSRHRRASGRLLQREQPGAGLSGGLCHLWRVLSPLFADSAQGARAQRCFLCWGGMRMI
jgi:hypothetical protein